MGEGALSPSLFDSERGCLSPHGAVGGGAASCEGARVGAGLVRSPQNSIKAALSR